MTIYRFSDDDLKTLAKDYCAGRIYTDRHIPDGLSMQQVFMPFIFMSDDSVNEAAKEGGMVYEYMSEAGPRAINGQPMFMSMRIMHREDLPRFASFVQQVKQALDAI